MGVGGGQWKEATAVEQLCELESGQARALVQALHLQRTQRKRRGGDSETNQSSRKTVSHLPSSGELKQSLHC